MYVSEKLLHYSAVDDDSRKEGGKQQLKVKQGVQEMIPTDTWLQSMKQVNIHKKIVKQMKSSSSSGWKWLACSYINL